MKSLHILEEMAGIEIVAPLVDRLTQVMSTIGLTLTTSDQKKLEECESIYKRLEFTLDLWKSRKKSFPPTWNTLLYVLERVDLKELGSQIHDYLGEPMQF